MKNENYIVPGVKHPTTPKDAFELKVVNWHIDVKSPIDFIYGVDPAIVEGETAAKIILRTEKPVKWKKGDHLIGPNGIKFKIVNIGFWTWLHRLLSKDKYYNAKLTLIAEK